MSINREGRNAYAEEELEDEDRAKEADGQGCDPQEGRGRENDASQEEFGAQKGAVAQEGHAAPSARAPAQEGALSHQRARSAPEEPRKPT